MILLLMLIGPAIQANPLYADESVGNRENLEKNILTLMFAPYQWNPRQETPPPDEPVRWAAEWEQKDGVVLGWPAGFNQGNQKKQVATWAAMVDAYQDVGAVYLLHHDLMQRAQIRNDLVEHGVPLRSIEWIQHPYYYWDTGAYSPINIFSLDSGEWGIMDWNCAYSHVDNAVNNTLSRILGGNYYSSSLYVENGNLTTDGMGKAFTTGWIRHLNPDKTDDEIKQVFRDYLNTELTILPWPPISFHIDMHTKLIGPDTVLIGQWPSDDPNTPFMDEIVATFKSMTASTGNPYKIVRMPNPPDDLPGSGSGPSFFFWDARSYVNSRMHNGKVLVPTYNIPEDADALALYQEILPDWEIVPIDNEYNQLFGAGIHCFTGAIAAH